jgi:hypothetical protein
VCHSVHSTRRTHKNIDFAYTNPTTFYSLYLTFFCSFLFFFFPFSLFLWCHLWCVAVYTLETSAHGPVISLFFLRPPTPPLSDESLVGHVDALASPRPLSTPPPPSTKFCFLFFFPSFRRYSFRLLLVVPLPSTRRLPCSEMHVNFHLKLLAEDTDKLSLLKAFLFKDSNGKFWN